MDCAFANKKTCISSLSAGFLFERVNDISYLLPSLYLISETKHFVQLLRSTLSDTFIVEQALHAHR